MKEKVSNEIKDLSPSLQKDVISIIMQQNDGKTYLLLSDHIMCLICGKSSYSRGDMNELFCLQCGYHSDIMRDLHVPKRNLYAG